MKHTIFAILALASALTIAGAGQVDPAAERKNVMMALPEGPNISLTATAIQRQAPIVQLRGNVEIRTKDMILRADEAEYDQSTGEIAARGTVRIKLETQR